MSDLSLQDFCPEKYKGLCKIMCNKFIKTGDASIMLEAYLSVVTKGSCPNDDNGLFLVKDFDPRLSYVASPISGKCLIYFYFRVSLDCLSSHFALHEFCSIWCIFEHELIRDLTMGVWCETYLKLRCKTTPILGNCRHVQDWTLMR